MFLKVLLPLKLDWTPSYSSGNPLPEGTRVRVQFARKEYVGVVLGPDESPTVTADRILPIEGPAEGLPDITREELRFWEFLSSYYMCTLGEVFKAVYPQSRTDSEFVGARKAARKGAGISPGTRQGQSSLPSRPEVTVTPDRSAIYEAEIEKTLLEGRDVLILIPDFKLTAGLQKRLKKKFNENLVCYNTKMTVVQRRNVCEKIRNSTEPAVILGTKNALLLPFKGLGLIIVDEEQDPLYKQQEPAPRFNARDAAVVLAGIHGARIILGTPCPSFETLLNTQSGKYQSLAAFGVGGNHEMVGSTQPTPREGVSRPRIQIIDISAEKKKRGMRGDVSFKLENEIMNTGGRVAVVRWWEKEDEVKTWLEERFPDSKIDILTPSAAMTSASHYALTAVLQADALFDKTDFRSDEKVLQSLSRMAGRSDRLVIQTARAAHPVFRILTGEGDATPLLEERKDFNLPPYARIVDTVLSDHNPARRAKFAAKLAYAQPNAVRSESDDTVRFRTTLPRDASAAGKKALMAQSVRYIEKEFNYQGHIHFDVDPA